MNITLMLLGFSIIFHQTDSIYFLITNKDFSFVQRRLIVGYPSQFLERLGIFVDIFRLDIAIITLASK